MEAINLVNDLIRYNYKARPSYESLQGHRYFKVDLSEAMTLGQFIDKVGLERISQVPDTLSEGFMIIHTGRNNFKDIFDLYLQLSKPVQPDKDLFSLISI